MSRRIPLGLLALAASAVLPAEYPSMLWCDVHAADGCGALAYLTVVGSVTDSTGARVPDTTVTLTCERLGGEPLVETRTTDSEGKVRFEVSQRPAGDLSLVAWKPGYACGTARQQALSVFDRGPPRGSTVELPIRLRMARPLTLQIVDAQEVAVSAGRVGVTAIQLPDGTAGYYSPEPRLRHLDRRIQAGGKVTLDYLPPDGAVGISIESSIHGRQFVFVRLDQVAEGTTVQLLPTAEVQVTLTSADSASIADRTVLIESQSPNPPQEQMPPLRRVVPSRGVAAVRTDRSGKARAVVSAGLVSGLVRVSLGDRTFAKATTPRRIEPGQSGSIDLSLEPGRELRGKAVTERDEPVSGVFVWFPQAHAVVESGEDGSFSACIPAREAVLGRVVEVPEGFVWPFDEQFQIPSEAAESATPTGAGVPSPIIRVQRAAALSGRVVDATGQPLSGADVRAAWVQTHEVHSYFTLKSEEAQTGPDGRFQFSHVLRDVAVGVTAQTADAAVMAVTQVHTDGPKMVQLQVTPAGMVRLSGTVRGSDGRPVAKAAVELSRAMEGPGGQKYGSRKVEWGGNSKLLADHDGRFQTPGALPRFERYSVTISAPGYLGIETPLISLPAGGTDFELPAPMTTLLKARTVAGVVRDSAGKPVIGATVTADGAGTSGSRHTLTRVQAETDDQGRFTLDQLHPRAALALVDKDGFRTTGGPLLLGAGEASFRIYRNNEADPSAQTIRPVDDAEPRRAAARKLLSAIVPGQRQSGYFLDEALTMLARLDPQAVLDEVRQTRSASQRATGLLKAGELADALTEIESIEDGYRRAFARLSVIAEMRDPAEAAEALAAALVDADLIQQPERRVAVLAEVADHLLRRGDRTRAEQLLRDKLPLATALPTKGWAGFARGSFAERLAQIDPDAAMRLVGEAAADDQSRHYRNLAHALAASNPDVAEEALRRIKNDLLVDDPVVRVAYRMAAVDLPRALRLLERVNAQLRPTERAKGLGVVAAAVRSQHPDKAVELLKQAFRALPPQHGGGGSLSEDIFGTSLTLLGIAEEIDPANLADYYWLAVRNFPGPDGGAWSPDQIEEANVQRLAQLALLVCRYTHTEGLPEQIVEPVFAYWERQIDAEPGRFDDHSASFMAMALIHPERAVDWAVRFNDKLDKELRRRIPQPWEVMGHTLTRDRSGVAEMITARVFRRWVIDQYDF